MKGVYLSTYNLLLGSSIRGILQARLLEWVAISFSNYPLKHGCISLNIKKIC